MHSEALYQHRKTAEQEHNALTFVGLRAQATAAGLIQLCAELRRVGVIDDAAIDRIKQAVTDDLSVSLPRCRRGDDTEAALRARMDAIFARRLQAADVRGPTVGSSDQLADALGFCDRDQTH